MWLKHPICRDKLDVVIKCSISQEIIFYLKSGIRFRELIFYLKIEIWFQDLIFYFKLEIGFQERIFDLTL